MEYRLRASDNNHRKIFNRYREEALEKNVVQLAFQYGQADVVGL
ncbi:MAG: hypothetical protein ACF8CQ_01030 [Rhodopirellula sp. JB044]